MGGCEPSMKSQQKEVKETYGAKFYMLFIYSHPKFHIRKEKDFFERVLNSHPKMALFSLLKTAFIILKKRRFQKYI